MYSPRPVAPPTDPTERGLHEYIDRRDETPQNDIEALIDGLKSMPHPTVWAEMKRQYTLLPDIHALFSRAPEALNW